MSLLVYGVVGADGTAVVGTGIDEQPLLGVKDGRLMAIVTDHDGPGPDPDAATLDAYDGAIQALMESRAILPMPFGRVLADDDEVRAMLRRRRRDLLARLDRVHGAVELGLRARWLGTSSTDAGDPRPESGVSYLRDRLEMRQSARRLATELDPLTALARGIRRTLSMRRDLPVLDAYLVDRRRVGEFVALVAELGDYLEEVELICTGPCPPYSFAEGGVIRSTP